MSVPWLVAGAAHPAEVARQLAYAATQGGQGIAGPPHMKVQALVTPGNKVRVAPGGITILNRYPQGDYQSYIDRVAAEEQVTITATGAGAVRSDLIVRRVVDPQYPGEPAPPSTLNGPYCFYRVITGVPVSTKRAEDLNLGYPAEALARIDLPINTATITNAMITDLRRLANPRRVRDLTAVVAPTSQQLTTADNVYVNWPNPGSFQFQVPIWANYMQARVDLTNIYANPQPGDAYWRLEIDGLVGGSGAYMNNDPGTIGGGNAWSFVNTWKGDVTAWRGLTKTMVSRGARTAVSVHPNGFFATWFNTQLIYDIEFEERVV